MSNETGDSTLGYVGGLLADRLTALLAGEPGIRVATSVVVLPSGVDPGRVVDSLDDPARLGMLAREASGRHSGFRLLLPRGRGVVVPGRADRREHRHHVLRHRADYRRARGALEDGVDSLDRAIAAAVKAHAQRTAVEPTVVTEPALAPSQRAVELLD